MSMLSRVVLAVFGVLIICIVGCSSCAVILYNDLIAQEKGVIAQYDQNKNNYDNMWKKFKEVSQVPAMYTDDLKKVYDSAIQNRYGSNGSQAMFQWLQEHNPSFDSSIYKQIQQVVESGRNSFEANQTMLVDKKRIYVTKLAVFPNSIIASISGFPHIDLDKYDIVTSGVTEAVFGGQDSKQIDLR